MTEKVKKIQTYVSLTPKQKELLEEMVSLSAKSQSEVMGQLIENYQESFKRKFC